MLRQEPGPYDTVFLSGKQKPDAVAYLMHIGIKNASPAPVLSYLKKLQRNHLLHVPFENLDIQYFRKIDLHTESFYKKVVVNRRGGYCYELNGLFCWLLKKEGFHVEMISARVFNAKGIPGPEFDHLALVVTIAEKKYLVDVGFGDFSARPLLIRSGVEQHDDNGIFMMTDLDPDHFAVLKKQGRIWTHQYIFSLKAYDLIDFQRMHQHHQTSPESLFTQRKICSILTKKGRITLTNKRVIITQNQQKTTHAIHSENEFNRALEKYFGFRMDHP